MKRISAFLIAVFLVLFISVPAFAVEYPKPTSQFFVNDFAGCITDEDERAMQEMAEKLYNQTKAQVVCVTVESLDGMNIREYGLNLGREWGIGEKNKNTGVLLILSTSDRKIDIEVGYGLEGALPDGKTGRILDTYAMPYLKENDFSKGLKESFTVLINETSTELGVSVEGYEPIEENDSEFEDNSSYKSATIITLLLIAAIVIVLVRVIKKSGTGGPFGGSGNDDFGGTNNSGGGFFIGGFGPGSSGGGFGGGSFGGGGGFSGGGGSFGGGGSSRGF